LTVKSSSGKIKNNLVNLYICFNIGGGGLVFGPSFLDIIMDGGNKNGKIFY